MKIYNPVELLKKINRDYIYTLNINMYDSIDPDFDVYRNDILLIRTESFLKAKLVYDNERN